MKIIPYNCTSQKFINFLYITYCFIRFLMCSVLHKILNWKVHWQYQFYCAACFLLHFVTIITIVYFNWDHEYCSHANSHYNALYSKPFQQFNIFRGLSHKTTKSYSQLYICSDCNIITPITTEGSGITVSSCKTSYVHLVSPRNCLNPVKL